jgi:hypothetical protein
VARRQHQCERGDDLAVGAHEGVELQELARREVGSFEPKMAHDLNNAFFGGKLYVRPHEMFHVIGVSTSLTNSVAAC